ncbi:MAG: two-component regulator propeller domain-containing protein [Bacteroidota bacterium]
MWLILEWVLPQDLVAQPNLSKTQFPTNYIANVQHFSTEEGLSHWNAHALYQDDLGFIWIGTNYGLNRFDGHDFKVFSKEQDSLASNEVHQILEDAEGWLWIFKLRKPRLLKRIIEVSFVNIYTLEVQSVEERFGKNSMLDTEILFSSLRSPSKTIFLGTENGKIIQFRPETGFTKIDTDQNGPITLRHFTDESHLLYTVSNRDDLRTEQFIEIDTLGRVKWSHPTLGFSTGPIDTETQWFWRPEIKTTASPMKLSFLSPKGQIEHFPDFKRPRDIQFMTLITGRLQYRNSDDTFWYINRNNLWVFHPKRGLVYDFSITYPQIVGNTINQLFFDNRDNVWLSTENGVYKMQLALEG